MIPSFSFFFFLWFPLILLHLLQSKLSSLILVSVAVLLSLFFTFLLFLTVILVLSCDFHCHYV